MLRACLYSLIPIHICNKHVKSLDWSRQYLFAESGSMLFKSKGCSNSLRAGLSWISTWSWTKSNLGWPMQLEVSTRALSRLQSDMTMIVLLKAICCFVLRSPADFTQKFVALAHHQLSLWFWNQSLTLHWGGPVGNCTHGNTAHEVVQIFPATSAVCPAHRNLSPRTVRDLTCPGVEGIHGAARFAANRPQLWANMEDQPPKKIWSTWSPWMENMQQRDFTVLQDRAYNSCAKKNSIVVITFDDVNLW